MTLGFEAEAPPRYGITRAWAMPNSETFDVPPIAAFIERWHRPPSVDPFARNSEWATYRNDLSPDTLAQTHMEATDFCVMLAERSVRAECVLFDPPYSPGQIVAVYQSVGLAKSAAGQNGRLYREVRDGLDRLLIPGGIALSFGWNSAGFGRERGYEILEVLLVAHGGAHNDTICVAERKTAVAARPLTAEEGPYDLLSTGARNGSRRLNNPDNPAGRSSRGFMGKAWDGTGIAFDSATWAACLRVAKPSAYLLAFGGTRTVHRMTVAIEDAGWIIRDMLVWAYASGFPKSKASLKPAWEPIVMARKPGPLRELAIDACRIEYAGPADFAATVAEQSGPRSWKVVKTDATSIDLNPTGAPIANPSGRWPANVILTDELFEPGVDGVVIAGSLTGTMTVWSSFPDSEPNPTVSPADNAGRKSSRGVPGVSFRSSATEPAATQLDAWGTSAATSKPDIGCLPGTTEDGSGTNGSTAESGAMPTDPSQRATSSITETRTGSTIGSRTSSSSVEPSTPSSTSRSERGPRSDPAIEPDRSETLSDDSANWRPNSPLAESRAGEPSADRRYPGAFAALPGERRDVDGLGYSRFFLIPKADRADREPVLGGLPAGFAPTMGNGIGGREHDPADTRAYRRNVHPTVKPVDLMRHLVRLVTPTGGTVLDCFAGSGSTLLAAEMEGFAWIGIEKEAEYVAIAEARLNGTQRGLGLPA